jgi:hypothetical protein
MRSTLVALGAFTVAAAVFRRLPQPHPEASPGLFPLNRYRACLQDVVNLTPSSGNLALQASGTHMH